ncbi:MAG: ABC transporter permease subunit [Candidatus Latescibacteria bacterium]|nr:ABC transporter permease subunit [bacterium]MBD3424019.1 ABC transporter permease subunit [Candidatus Latescibacterota bacterium]
MRRTLFMMQKEFLQIFRNRQMLPIIFIMPVLQMCVLSFAATFEIKRIDLAVIDSDLTSTSRRLTGKLEGTPVFRISADLSSMEQGYRMVDRGSADAIVRIPRGFEEELQQGRAAELQLLVEGINQNAASLTYAYFQSVINDFNRGVIMERLASAGGPRRRSGSMEVSTSYWYNPDLDYKTFMVPGIMVLMITIIGMFLSSMNVVREKEMGTIEQINVTPVRKSDFIIGKLAPIWVIGLADFGFGMVLGKILFDIPMVGSIFLVFLFAAVYLPVVLGLGLYISTLSGTQQQAMFISFFFLIIFILMSGLFTPIESMPAWARELDRLNPLTYFIRVIRMILLKGSGLKEVWSELVVLACFAAGSVSLAVARYRKSA